MNSIFDKCYQDWNTFYNMNKLKITNKQLKKSKEIIFEWHFDFNPMVSKRFEKLLNTIISNGFYYYTETNIPYNDDYEILTRHQKRKLLNKQMDKKEIPLDEIYFKYFITY